jgi:Cys-tRNA(Pro)/Cys-tRNA(Cys) deacylase
VSPIGQKKKLRTLIDQSGRVLDTMYVSAGRRGLEVALRPEDLTEVVEGVFVELCS